MGRPAEGAEVEEFAGASGRSREGEAAEVGSPSRVCPAPEEEDRAVGVVGRPAAGAEVEEFAGHIISPGRDV